jgi:hypothetical protein
MDMTPTRGGFGLAGHFWICNICYARLRTLLVEGGKQALTKAISEGKKP